MGIHSLQVRPFRYPQPSTLPLNASAAEHVRSNRDFVRYCIGETRGARLCGLSDRLWLRALKFARFALALSQQRLRREQQRQRCAS